MSALRIPPLRNGSGAVPQVLLGFGVLAAMGLAAFAWLASARRSRRPRSPGADDAESGSPGAAAPEIRSEPREPAPEAEDVRADDPKAGA